MSFHISYHWQLISSDLLFSTTLSFGKYGSSFISTFLALLQLLLLYELQATRSLMVEQTEIKNTVKTLLAKQETILEKQVCPASLCPAIRKNDDLLLFSAHLPQILSCKLKQVFTPFHKLFVFFM
jgi:hypothetical protein